MKPLDLLQSRRFDYVSRSMRTNSIIGVGIGIGVAVGFDIDPDSDADSACLLNDDKNLNF